MKIICIGRNYVAHIEELGNQVPEEPVIFMKPQTALNRNHKMFFYPAFTNELHYECELVLRICKNGKNIDKRDAGKYFDQITVGIDFTARDLQNQLKEKGLPWEKAKAFDDAAIIGTWIKTETLNMDSPLFFTLEKNGSIVQHGNSSLMIFPFDKILEEASRYFTLNIGDLIFTGTPAGVGECVSGDELKGYLGNNCLFELIIK